MASAVDFVVKIKKDGASTATVVAGQKNAALSESVETIDVTTKDNFGAKAFKSGLSEWSIEADGLVTDGDAGYEALRSAFSAKTAVDIELSNVKDPKAPKQAGKAIITSIDTEYGFEEVVYKVKFQGTGALTRTYTP